MLRRALTCSALLALWGAFPANSIARSYRASPPTEGALYADGQSGRYLLGGDWLYRRDANDTGVSQGFWRDANTTAGWSATSVPNADNAGDFSGASMNGYVGWYRRDFTLPPNAFARYVPRNARRWIIRFESVNYRATVWLNGHRVGSHAGAYLPWELLLRRLRPGVNRLIVRVDGRRRGTDLPPGPGGLWWNFGGIVREVYLRAVQRADLAAAQIRPRLPCPRCAATVQERVIVRNPTGVAQTVRLHGAYGRIRIDFGSSTLSPGASWTPSATLRVAHPRLWWIGHPALYHARLTLTDAGGRVLQRYDLDSGIRSIVVTRGGRLKLNGRLLHLRGVSLHEQDVVQGSALDPAHVKRMTAWIRALGATLIRSHYPLNPQIQQIADRNGILIWSEIPVYQVPYSGLADRALRANARTMLAENIEVNQNHPSVLLWSIGNELPVQATGPEASYIAQASALAHRLDPTRPVALDVSDWGGVKCQAGYVPLDVIGANEYYGWFDAGGGATDDRDALSSFLDEFRSCYPHKALFVTEFGFDANRDGPVDERGTYAFQSNSIAFHLGVFASKQWLSGAVYWLVQDFAAKPGWDGGNPRGNPPFVTKGLVDLQGARKPAFAVLSAIYHQTRQIAPAR